MDNLEKVEKLREKTGVSYEEAKAALEATNYDVLDAIIQRDMLSELLDCLTERQREVITAYFFDGLTQQQIADKLGIAKQSVNENLKAAIKKMKKISKNF